MRLVLALVILAGIAATSPAAVLRVWSAKYPTIQSAIDAAKNGDTVLVGKGWFWGSVDFKGKAITVKTEFGPEHTAIRGTVYFRTGEGRNSILEGFSIWPAATRIDNIGVSLVNASPTIRGNHIGGKDVPSHEACVHCTGGRPLIEGNVIAYGYDIRTAPNTTVFAPGVRLYHSNAEILYNRIEHNTAPGASTIKVKDAGRGGGMYVSGGAPRIEGNLIRDNSCTGNWAYGGGIFVENSRAVIARNAILDNVIGQYGGSGTLRGAGICAMAARPEIHGNVIAGNHTEGLTFNPLGAGVYTDLGRVTNNTIYGNTLRGIFTASGAGIWGTPAVEVRNNILWKNTGAYTGNSVGGVTTITVHHNLVGDGQFNGVNGNITADPLFVNAAGGDFHLRFGSPCIDAGSAVSAPSPIHDLDFEPRVIDGNGDTRAVPDMGADEFATLRKPAIFVRPGTEIPLALIVPAAARRTYVLACALGHVNGIPLPPPDPRRIPLDADGLFWTSVARNNVFFADFLGVLDARGEAAAGITVPKSAALAGLTFHVSGITIRADARVVILNRLDIDVLP